MLNRFHPLSKISHQLRLDLLGMIYASGSGHIGGSLSSLDILISLYHSNIFDFKKDHFILSAGHLACALYTVLASKKYFPANLLSTYTDFDSILQGHISKDVPGVEYSSGSLGQGLSFATGLALGDPKHTTICLTSDGEHQEGQIWESVMFSKKYKLGNLINIVDCNGLQIDGTTQDIMPLNNLAAKYVQFGWTVTTVDGHNFNQLIKSLKQAKNSDYPNCIIANTVLGKGVSFMENNYKYHDVKNLDEKTYLAAKDELTL
ncbi:MAG: transketolase [Candidatus Shapirobacteria bacterium]|jgi:transketolase|nr:transketolase [Candidatus Shapirobacteria bacterium]